MIRCAFFALLALLVTSSPVWAALITVTIPDMEIPYTATTYSFTLQAEFDGSFSINNYEIDMKLTPQGGATRVTFDSTNPATEASSDYVFGTTNVGWSTNDKSTSMEIYGDDSPDPAPRALGDVTKNLITLKLDTSALTAANIGDTYLLEFTGKDSGGVGRSEFWDDSWDKLTPQGLVDWTDTGTITITPEPGSIVMLVGLGISSLVFYRRRRKR